MSPKVKAQVLYNTYIDYTFGHFNCKQCALIAVDEIIKINWYHSEPTCFDDLANEHKEKSIYWNEVKQELENL